MLQVLDTDILRNSPFVEQLNQFSDDLTNTIAQNQGPHIVSKVQAVDGYLEKLPIDKAQALLNALPQLQQSPEVLAGVYATLAQVWPLPSKERGLNYNAQNLFDSGIAVVPNLGESDEAVDLLESVSQLHKSARLKTAENQDNLVATAYSLWSYDPESVESIWQGYPEAKRTPDKLSQLTKEAESVEEEEDFQRLEKALIHEIGCAEHSEVGKATQTLLGEPAKKTDSSPDVNLSTWASAVAQTDPQMLVDTLMDENLNDEQANRLYHRLLENVDKLSAGHIQSIVEAILPVESGRDKTSETIVGSLEGKAARLIQTEKEKRSLCDSVLAVFSKIPKQETKAKIASICTEWGLKNVMADGNYKETLSKDDLEIVEKYTGTISS